MQRWGKITLLVIVIAALSARVIPGPRTIDDAYITYRYAQNLLSGEGLVYNAGEQVLGTTTPLYAGLMALLGLFTGGAAAPFPIISLTVNTLADSLTCLLLFLIARKLNRPLAGVAAAAVWAVLPFSVTFAIGGMETSVFVVLLTASFYFHLERWHKTVALLAALAILTRPDALIFLGPLALDRLYRHFRSDEKISFSEVAMAAVPLAAWIAFATAVYGSPIPHSIAAKSVAYSLPGDAAFIRLLQHYTTPFLGNLTFGPVWIAVGLILYPFLFLLGARTALKNTPRSWPWLVFPWAYFAAYAIANPLIFRWYLTPPLPAYLWTIFLGLDVLITNILATQKLDRSRWAVAVTLGILILPTVGLTLRGWEGQPAHGLERPAPEMAWYELELFYQRAAEILLPALEISPGTVAAADVGAVGYYTGAPILDVLGLMSPEVTAYYPTNPEYYVNAFAVSPEAVRDFAPEYIVLLEVYGREGLFKQPWFAAEYELLETLETNIYESEGMLIFRKVR